MRTLTIVDAMLMPTPQPRAAPVVMVKPDRVYIPATNAPRYVCVGEERRAEEEGRERERENKTS